MKITFNRQQLLAAFSIAAVAVPGRTPRDILRSVLMSVTKAGVELIATDLEIGVRVIVEGAVTSSVGEAMLPTARMGSILRELADDVFEMEVDGDKILIKAANGKFRLTSEDPKEYPPVPEFKEADYYRVSGPVFRLMIRRTEFATDTDSTRYALGGINVEFDDGRVNLAATDSRRLAVSTAVCDSVGTPKVISKATVVPTKAMRLLERSADPKSEFIDISVADNSVTMRAGNVTVYSRLVEGRFPRYRDVIPKKSKNIVPFSVSPFFSAVRQAQIVTDEEHRGVDFTFNDSLLVIKSQASVGDSSVELPIEYGGEKMKVAFDPKYVSDFLKVCSPEAIVDLHLIDADTAAVFRVEDSYTYVIMPLSGDR